MHLFYKKHFLLTSIFKPLYYWNDAQFLTNRHLMETKNLVISFDYSWFLAKNLAYAKCPDMKFHYRNSSTSLPTMKFYRAQWGQMSIVCSRWVSVVEFHDPALGIGKVFGQESTVVKWNYQILGLHQVTVHQKLGVILVIKWFKNWSQ